MEVTKDIIHLKESDSHQFSLKLYSHDNNKTQFLMESSPAIINTIRRIILDETPTMAPDTMVVHQNTSVMHDEVLAQRIGLIPLAVDPRQFDFPDDQINEQNTIVFTLHAKAGDKPLNVYSGDLQYTPIGNQLERIGNVRPLEEKILLLKLGAQQEIKLEIYCHKGIGKVHSKWSPVSVCFYNMLPIFKHGETKADWNNRQFKVPLKLQCPMGVYDDLEEIKIDKCTLCRSCLDTGVQIMLDDQHYLFTIEPVGYLNGLQIMQEALNVLKIKAHLVVDGLM
ncbi:DNA-directed_RNA polymerase subunit D [Hexamita inflata]|uniref:DNA-directed_RNA polymerase subunit D n=1 Tax=Hexamita inflata TaxID=28002 RepID=A0ABP1HZ10_9EUKA